MTIFVDHTHLGRHVTGLERITLELFSADSFGAIEVQPITANGTKDMVLKQTFALPRRMMDSKAVLLCPGFPPSPLLLPFAARVVPYIHDVFLISRPHDLNIRAALYMAKPFALAVRHYPRFLVNSVDTGRKLAALCRSDAEIVLYRPHVRNVFAAQPRTADSANRSRDSLKLVSLGTVEPRKNFHAAARVVAALRRTGFPQATLEIIGRPGWGKDWEALARQPGVVLSGYRPADYIREALQDADAYICTSHDEGLGLPLLEAQYAGLPVIAPDDTIFREVLGDSGVFISRTDPDAAARAIIAMIGEPDWRRQYQERDARNLQRWNRAASDDRNNVAALLGRLVDAPPRERLADSGALTMSADGPGQQRFK